MAFESQHDVVIIYHKNCLDGLAAGWVVWKYYGGQADTVAVQYGDDFEDIFGQGFGKLIGKRVICVDFAFDLHTTKHLMSICSLLVLDHHDTALKELAPIAEKEWEKGLEAWFKSEQGDGGSVVVVDNRHSGAMLAWKWFNVDNVSSACPLGIIYAEDYDMWWHKHPNTKHWVAAAFSYEMNVTTFDTVINKDIDELVAEGVAIQRHIDKTVKGLSRSARRFKLDDYDVPIVNANSLFRNELGAALSVGEPFSVTYADGRDGRQYSLRSKKDGGVHVGEIAKRFGGGGHANSAAFRIPLTDEQFHHSHEYLSSYSYTKVGGEWAKVPKQGCEHGC
jgi:hypothetical protein